MERLGSHLGAASRQLQNRSPATSGSSARSTDAPARLALLAKLFVMFPPQGGEETMRLRMHAYMTELADLHVDVLSRALRRVTREKRPNAEWLPTVYQIREKAAHVIRDARIRAKGGDPGAAPRVLPFEINVEREIAAGPKPGARILALQAGT